MTYLDTSALVSLVLQDAHSAALLDWIGDAAPEIATSTFGQAEFNAVVAQRVRGGTLTAEQGTRATTMFEGWFAAQGRMLDLEASDARVAAAFVRRPALALRASDALHIAVCHRLGLPLLTFDRFQAAAARALGVARDPAGDS